MSWFPRITPGFPQYTGPYSVGSADFEIPVSSLDSPASSPDSSISTVAFRIFYPCEASAREKAVKWLTYPHRGYVQAYARFLGAHNLFAQLFSYFPHLLYYATIPVKANAESLQANTESQRWPVVIFSHGLGGSRNAYSHICGTLASHGIVVIAPEHRDGSAPVTYIKSPSSGKVRPLYYRRASHTPSPEVYEHRDNQLKIRLWELGLIHDAILKLDEGSLYIPANTKITKRESGELNDVVNQLQGQLDVHTPGSIVMAGHSFGAATMVQFTKSVYYNDQSDDPSYQPLYTPSTSSSITRQITPATTVLLLDMFCLPLRSPSTEWLWSQPMPCYAPSGSGGDALLAVLSETFSKWKGNLSDMKLALSEDPTGANLSRTKAAPTFFYPTASAHLSQSDFGILFPRVTRVAFKSEEPERCLKLNARAMLQKMRENGFEVASTAQIDAEEEDKSFPVDTPFNTREDWRILATNGGIKGWIPINIDDGTESEISEGKEDIILLLPRTRIEQNS
ncbi:hypothetical protein NA57DRAFT_64939 [Rhizodiscina lignyota]|uniref:Putative phospholipase n=1 Tax=Rhizodiscina lignyota TaxID=1504668 RepID=A0A9P4M7E1_9PEZI|nr:hypothetical protein NA57DRAFT_64939 [Rhizodiscina lignyota]